MFAKFIIAFISFGFIKSAKILIVILIPSISHHLVYRPFIQELINHRHEVTVITTDPVYPQGKSPDNLTEINTHNSSYFLWKKMTNATEQSDLSDIVSVMTGVAHAATKIFEEQIKDQNVQQLLKDKTVKFDLVVLEATIYSSLVYGYIFKAPVIYINSFGANPLFMEAIGATTHPLLFPTHFHQRIYNLTFWEKISELYKHVMIDQLIKTCLSSGDIILQNFFGTDAPIINDLTNNIHMLFLNIHPVLIHNQPATSNVVYTWGIHKPPERLLPTELQSYLDSSEHGVIYISFGSNIKTSVISPDKLEIFVKVLSQLPYKILWKWDTDELPGKSDNIKISKWFPQYDILRHPNVKLFITQGGLQSTDEAINAGVPLIGIPVYVDQTYNTEKYEYFKIGIQLKLQSLTVEKFGNAIKTILADASYRKNIIQLRRQLHDQPKPALENAIWWVDYTLRHKGTHHLRTPAADMSWTEYYELELVLMMISGLAVLVTLLIATIYTCFKRMQCIISTVFSKPNVAKHAIKIK